MVALEYDIIILTEWIASRKDKRVSIRISSQDLELLQVRALREGIRYLTLMASMLHKFVYGTLGER